MEIKKITDEEYFNSPRLSAHASYKMVTRPLEKDAQTRSLTFGRALHCYLLENSEFGARFAVAPELNKRTKEGKEEWAKFENENAGKDILTAEEFSLIKTMAERARDIAPATFDKSKWTGRYEIFFENAVFFVYETEDGDRVECKMKPDILLLDHETKTAHIVDVKTTADATPQEFAKSCANYGYAWQASFYALPFLKDDWLVEFKILAVEKSEDGTTGVFNMSEFVGIELPNVVKFLENYRKIRARNEKMKYYSPETFSAPKWYKGTNVEI